MSLRVSNYRPRPGRQIKYDKSTCKVVPGQAYTIKELFQRHLAGGSLPISQHKDIGTGVDSFDEFTQLDYLEGDLTDLDTIHEYRKDYEKRLTKMRQEHERRKQQESGTNE